MVQKEKLYQACKTGYCYLRNKICPHCDHENIEKTMDVGILFIEVILVDLNRKTMEFEVYG